MRTSNVFKLAPVTALILLMSCAQGAQKTGETAEETNTKPKVKLETVHIQDVEQLGEFTATVLAGVSNKIAPQAPVRIRKLHVEVGDHVSSGQLLATMDTTSLRQTKIQIDNQETEFRRIDELYKVGGVSKSVWDAQKTALEVSKEAYRNLQENNQLLSPISGLVTARNYDSGDMYSGALPVYVVEQIRPVKLMINVSESYFTKVKKGMDADIRLDVYGSEVFKGRVSLIYPTIDPSTRTFPVELRIANQDERVRPGMFARVTMNFGSLQRVVAPDLSIVKQTGSGDRYIYVYQPDGTVSYRKVALGRRLGDRYEILSGIEDGDRAVVSGQSRLTNGAEVEIVN
ncbi:MAG: efflux RND transporter periplasmic adaptor subunit [Tannerellaceae bacterium]|jgi:RND family efflux transporter MFP subunit|nr:efflux RND transporter periplasmic adaptor subunit [Tannerellaceae bacterium]